MCQLGEQELSNVLLYLESSRYYKRMMMVNKKMKSLIEALKWNPISDTSLFKGMKTQYLYERSDDEKDGMKEYIVKYKVTLRKLNDLKLSHIGSDILFKNVEMDATDIEPLFNKEEDNNLFRSGVIGMDDDLQEMNEYEEGEDEEEGVVYHSDNDIPEVDCNGYVISTTPSEDEDSISEDDSIKGIKFYPKEEAVRKSLFFSEQVGCSSLIEEEFNILTLNKLNSLMDVTSVADECFKNIPTTITALTLPRKVRVLNDSCFENCLYLKEIEMSKCLTFIGEHCFKFCRSLTKIEIPDSVEYIGKECFCLCNNLKKLTLPTSLSYLSSNCFYRCDSIEEIKIPDTITSLGDGCFNCCYSLKELTLPSSIESLGKECFRNCSQLSVIKHLNSITYIGDDCFENCKELKFNDLQCQTTLENSGDLTNLIECM